MRRRGSLASVLLLAVACPLIPKSVAGLPLPTPLQQSISGLAVTDDAGVTTASWTSTLHATRLQILNDNAVLAHLGPAGSVASRRTLPIDADATVTVSYTPTYNPIEFDATPVLTPHSLYPFIWARKAPTGAVNPVSGEDYAAAVLTPADTYRATAVTTSWPVAYTKVPARALRGHGRLSAVGLSASMQQVGYTTTARSGSSSVLVASGMLVGTGGAVHQHDRHNFVRFPLGSLGAWPKPAGVMLVFYLLPDGVSGVDWALTQTGSQLSASAKIQGKLPARSSVRRRGQRFDTSAVPFVIVAANGTLSPLSAVPSMPVGTRGAVVTQTNSRPVQVTPNLPVALDAQAAPYDRCLFGLGQDTARSDVWATPAPTGTPRLTRWLVGSHRRAELASLQAGPLTLDGSTWTPSLQDAVARLMRPVVPWEDDLPDSMTATDFYNAFTYRCLFGDPTEQTNFLESWPGLRFGMEQRSVFVHGGVLVEVRVAAAPVSRLTYPAPDGGPAPWPIARIRVTAFSIDGYLHTVTFSSMAKFTEAMTLELPNVATGGYRTAPDGTYPTQFVNDALAGQGVQDMIANGEVSPATFGLDAAGRTTGADSVITVSRTGNGTTQLVGSSNASPADALPTYATGFLTALIAQK